MKVVEKTHLLNQRRMDSADAVGQTKSAARKREETWRLSRPWQECQPGLFLQRMIGNRATGRVLQAELKIDQPDDKCEREADRIANLMMRMPKPAIQRKLSFGPECNNFQRCTVIEPLIHAKQMVDAAIASLVPVAAGKVTSGRIINLLNVHFRVGAVSKVSQILKNYRTIKAELDGGIRYVCYKDAPDDCKSEKGFVGAFTSCTAGADVHLCPIYHLLGCEEEARQLVHEIAHHLGFCRDHAYVDEGMKYLTLSHAQSMANPDTYAQFAKMVFLGTPSCKECDEEIQIHGTRY